MKNKNGFVFVETMIVVVVLISILLVIYSSYVGLIRIERRYGRYDDPAFIYKTYAIGDFLINLKDENDFIIKNKIEENENNLIFISTTDTELFNENENKQIFFSRMYFELHVQTILIISKEQIKNVKEKEITSDLYKYLKSIDVSKDKDKQFYLVVMYAEKVNGDSCDPNSLAQNNDNNVSVENRCTFYYSSLKLEEDLP